MRQLHNILFFGSIVIRCLYQEQMPFDIGESINYITDSILSSGSIRGIVSSPFYVAAVLATIIILITVVIFRDSDCGDCSLWTLAVRSGFWSFSAILVVIYFHYHVAESDNRRGGRAASYVSIMKDPIIADVPAENILPRELSSSVERDKL